MNAIETRLPGSRTTPAHVVRALDRAMGRTMGRAMGRRPPARVELRYSTQAELPLPPQAVKQAIARLLQQHGYGQVAISVRAHEGAIEDATGEHLLRLVPQAAPEPTPPAPRGRAWWHALWPWAQAPAGSAAAARTEPGLQPQSQSQPQPQPPAVGRALAVRLLREAVAKAAAEGVADPLDARVTSDAHAAPAGGRQGLVAQALVIVRLQGLHAALEPLVRQDARAVAEMVQRQGLALAPAFCVAYRHEPPQAGDGTGYASEGDLEVRLLSRPAAPAVDGAARDDDPARRTAPQPRPRAMDAPMSAHRSASTDAEASAGATAWPTALPGSAQDATAMPEAGTAAPMLRVRVLGTAQAPLAQPLDLPAAALPARLDRSTLARAGGAGGQDLPADWLVVVSQRCPLTVEAGADGRPVLHAPRRALQGGGEQPMYFDARTRRPLALHTALQPGVPLQVFANDPSRPLIGPDGRRHPALLVELRSAGC